MEWTTEHIFTSPDCLAVVKATPLQRAIARAMDGRPIGDLWDHPTVPPAFGHAKPPEGVTPAKIVIVSAIWTGKTLFAAAKAIRSSQVVDCTGLLPSDEVRIPVLATGKDQAGQGYKHIVGNLLMRPELGRIVNKDIDPTAESIYVKHPTGRPIEITISAMARAGMTLISRRLPCVIFDEATRVQGLDDGAVKNLEEQIDAVEGRILPGGCILIIGSPHAPLGPVYHMVSKYFGRPTQDCLVIRARGPDMNPTRWTPERCAELRRRNPRAYRTDVEAEFADTEHALIPSAHVERAMRTAPKEHEPVKGGSYVAVMDPGGRASAWTFLILEATEKGFRVALAKQWTKDIKGEFRAAPVMDEIAADCKRYGCADVWSDAYGIEATSGLADERKLTVLVHDWNAENRWTASRKMADLLENQELELPPDDDFRDDLVRIRKKPTSTGLTIIMPSTGKRHCDYFAVLALALLYPPDPPANDVEEKPKEEDPFLEDHLKSLDRDQYEAAAGRLGGAAA